MARMARTMLRSTPSASTAFTKDLSIFRHSAGN
jgi:hypothetical protein